MTLEAKGVSRRYLRKSGQRNFFDAVRETDFLLPPGQLTEITGRSGSGKSTLLHMLAGLLTPTAGEVLLDGVSLYALDEEARAGLRARAIGVIPQGHAALHSLTVRENVALPCLLAGEEPGTRPLALLERVGIAALADCRPDELSGGELRRLAIARALVRRPGVLLADEPTGDLDDENTRAVLALLRDTARDGAAVLLVTHEREAAAYAGRVWEMEAGALREIV